MCFTQNEYSRCYVDCGNSDCKRECPKLCGIHWSYKNRKEYEAEFYQLLIRLVDYGRSLYKPIPESLLTGYKHIDVVALAKVRCWVAFITLRKHFSPSK